MSIAPESHAHTHTHKHPHTHTHSKPTVTENTLASFEIAGEHGADYVEFDVQLTKDNIPIVYHDDTVCTTLAREGLSWEHHEMSVKDLTLHQLHSLKLDHTSVLEKIPDVQGSSPVSDSTSESYNSPNQASWDSKRRASQRENSPENKPFPTLKKVSIEHNMKNGVRFVHINCHRVVCISL